MACRGQPPSPIAAVETSSLYGGRGTKSAMMQAASRMLRAAQSHWHRLGRDESGSALALVAVVPVLAGAVAIGVETGELYRVKRQMQSSSDAAALAGAYDRLAGKSAAIIQANA